MKKILVFFFFRGFWVGKKKYGKENLEERKGAAARGRKKLGSTCIGGDFGGSTCTEEEKGQQLGGGKNRGSTCIGFFLGSTCIGGDFGGSTCTEEEEGQQLSGGRKRAAAGRFFFEEKNLGTREKIGHQIDLSLTSHPLSLFSIFGYFLFSTPCLFF